MIDNNKKQTLLITCAKGIVPYLSQEVEQLGFAIDSSHATGIEITATLNDAARLNLSLRSAYNVLLLLKKFPCYSPDDLYHNIKFIAWEDIISTDEYLSVVSVADTPHLNNSVFASRKVKDAIVDRIFDVHTLRPSSGPERDNVVINLYWNKDQAWVYLNTSGKKLSDRGYRKLPFKAPLQETLAASLLLAAEYNGSLPLVVPMCGSGTLAIEAALIALHRAPGLLRSNFGLMHLKDFDRKSWDRLRKDLRGTSCTQLPQRIIASDNDRGAIAAARKNAQTAGVDKLIEFHKCDFANTPLPEEKGIIMLNPGYGQRMGETSELRQTYKEIGDYFKKSCPGFTGYIFTGNLTLAKQVGLRTSRRLTFYNAKIECRLLEYKLYEGSKG